MKKKAAIYTRVSTNEQTKGYSLPTQVKGCKEYAERHNLEVVAIFKDDISGVTLLSEREGGKALLDIVKQIDSVIVWRLDRLSRPPEDEYSRLLTTIEQLARYDVTVHECESGEVKNDMASIMIAFFKGMTASQERTAIRERTMRGIEAKARAGNWIGQGDAPYGYEKIGRGRETFLDIHPERAKIVQRIFELYIGIHGEPLSLKQIAALLTKEGVPSPGLVKNGGRTGKGGWYTATISKRILSNPNYIGIFTAQGYIIDKPELAIIDEETWELAQERKKLNRRLSRRNQKRKYLLAGRIKCICGRSMPGESKKRRDGGYHIYYRCQNRRYDHLVGRCSVGYVRAETIEEEVWNWLKKVLSDPDEVKNALLHMTEDSITKTKPLKEDLASVERLLVETKDSIKRLIAAFSDEKDEVAAEALRSNYKDKVQLKNSLEKERQSILVKLNQVELTHSLIDEIITIATEIASLLPRGSFEKKRHVLDVLNVLVELREGDTESIALYITCHLNNEPMLIGLFDRGFKSRRPDRRKKTAVTQMGNGRFLHIFPLRRWLPNETAVSSPMIEMHVNWLPTENPCQWYIRHSAASRSD